MELDLCQNSVQKLDYFQFSFLEAASFTGSFHFQFLLVSEIENTCGKPRDLHTSNTRHYSVASI